MPATNPTTTRNSAKSIERLLLWLARRRKVNDCALRRACRRFGRQRNPLAGVFGDDVARRLRNRHHQIVAFAAHDNIDLAVFAFGVEVDVVGANIVIEGRFKPLADLFAETALRYKLHKVVNEGFAGLRRGKSGFGYGVGVGRRDAHRHRDRRGCGRRQRAVVQQRRQHTHRPSARQGRPTTA